MLLKDLIADVPSKHKRTRILGAFGGKDVTVAEVVEKITNGYFIYPLANLHRYPNLGRESIDALWPLLQPHLKSPEADIVNRLRADGSSLCIEAAARIERLRALNAQHVVSSPPQPTTEGFVMADQEQTDFATNLANQISEALQAGMDIEEIKAVLIETLDEMEAQIADAEEAKENGEGENA